MSILVAPGQPALRVNATSDEIVRYSPRCLDVVDLERRSVVTCDIAGVLEELGEAYPEVHRVVSLVEEDRVVKPSGRWIDFSAARAVRILADGYGHPVEIEFASDGRRFFLLQFRPQTPGRGMVAAPIRKDVAADDVLFTANRFVSNGRTGDITHIVYVDPEKYQALGEIDELAEVGRVVARLNVLLPKRRTCQ